MSEEQDQHRARLQNAVAALKKLQSKLDAAERANREPIAIIGAGCRIPGDTNSPEAFWKLLRDGVDTAGVLPSDRWDATPLLDENPYTPGKMFTRYGNYLKDVAGFDPQFFGIAPREAMSLDPQQRMLLEVSWEALENAGQAPDLLAGTRSGVFVGMSVDDYAQFHLRSGNFADIDAYTCSGAGLCFGAGRISYVLGLHGPCMNIDTACASALTAVHLACQSLRSGECDLALAGGINLILTPEVAIGMSALRALSPDGRCKAFDASADGFGRGEGCAMVTLKRVSDAVAAGDTILAVILGSAINHDGASGGLMVPNGLAQEALLRDALARSGVGPLEVQYVEAHGTGTALGDPIEVEALQAVLGRQRAKSSPLLVGSVKTNIGHLEAASGVVGLIKVALSLKNREIPPHLHFRTPSPHIPWDRMEIAVPTEPTAWPEGGSRRVAGVSAFGMSGTNVHVVVGEAPEARLRPDGPDRPLHVLRLSAKSPAALREMALRLGDYLEAHGGLDFGDVCYSLNTGRAQFSQRLAVVAANPAEAREKLAAFASETEPAGVFSRRTERGERPKVVFLFTGQGGQYAGMGRELYETQPAFRRAMDRCEAILRPLLERPLLQVIYPGPEDAGRIDQTAYTQPALFAIEYSLAELWRSWGVQPAAALGHSIGEYVAACVAGVFSLEDGLKLVAARGRLMQGLPASGAMAAVFAGAATVEAAVRPYAEVVSIAAVNGPEETVVSGEAARIARLVEEFEAAGIKAKRLTVSHAFHSPLMEPMLDAFERIAAEVSYQEPRIPVISNLTGKPLTAAELKGGAYWRRHARGAVQFVAGIDELQARGFRIFLEAGPRPSLAGLGRQIFRDPAAVWLGSLRKDQSDWKQMLTSLATLHLHGVGVDWKAFDSEYGRRMVALPTYPFQKTRFWAKRPDAAARAAAAPALHPLLHERIPLSLPEKVFVSVLGADSPAYLRDHSVHGSVVVPATAYLEMALEAGRQVFGEGAHALEGVRFREGIVLREGVAETVQLVLTPEEPGRMRFEIRRREAGTGGESWRLHVSGRIAAEDREEAPAASRSIGDIRQRCQEEVEPSAYYERFRRLGMEYGPRFQGLQAIYRNSGESLGRVAASADPELAKYQFHPALLDAALQGMAAGLPDGYAEQGLGIPVGVERYCVYRRPGASVWCHSVVRQNPDGSGISGDAQVLGESGEILADVQGLRVKQMRERERVMAPVGLEKAVYEVQWRRQELPGGAEGRNWAIVGDPGGLGRRLAAALVAAGDGAVVIENGDRLRAVPCSGVVSLDAMEQGTALDVCLGALEIVQALASASAAARLFLVSRGGQRVGTEAAAVALAQAALWGFGAAVAAERPDLHCSRVDLDPDEGEGESWLTALVAELRGGSREDRVAFRNGERLVARIASLETAAAEGPQRLQQNQPGVLSGLTYSPASRPAPGEGEVVIEVRATGLNFRDVLNALGLYPGDAGALGDECAGTVVAVGAGVTNCKVGDEVVALASGSFGTFATALGALTIPRPAALRAETAAGIPIAFLTAAYALGKVARIRAGERVLIHAAAGGVGLAAVRIARRMGAEVFATAGSEEKRAFLRSEGVEYVFDSRNLEFGNPIREITGGRGIDAVLNSLGP